MNGAPPKYYKNIGLAAHRIPEGVNIDFFDYQPSACYSTSEKGGQQLNWLQRFPFLESLSLLASEDDAHQSTPTSVSLPMNKDGKNLSLTRIPYISNHKLPNNKVILPVGYAPKLAFPAGLPMSLPEYMYSALAVFHAGEWIFFDGDYTSSHEFWNDFKNISGVMPASNGEEYFWGIIVLKDKLPNPIAISRQTSFHLGYNDQILPQVLHLSLSTLCNIRCTICGSQNFLNASCVKGHIINTEFLLKIADVFFPYVDLVEFNSFGEQLLYDDFPLVIDLLNKHGCQFMLQTNGTTLPDQKLNAILSGRGMVTFSIDATGKIFESQRAGAKWNVVEENIRRIISKRNPERIKVGISPTITCKTLPYIIDLCRWANTMGVDYVHLHYYNPIPNGIEKRPSLDEQNEFFHDLREYIATESPRFSLKLENQRLTWEGETGVPSGLSSPHKYPDSKLPDERSCYSQYKCILPLMMAQITPDEMLFPGCCRLYNRTFTCPTSDDEFFSLWFGKEVSSLRDSLKFAPHHPPMIPECQKCLAAHYRKKIKRGCDR